MGRDVHTILDVPLDKIRVNPFQPRRNFEKEELEELAASIQKVGLLHPPVVRRDPYDPEMYELIVGERRFRAAKLAGLSSIPVVVKEWDEIPSAEAALIENIQRVDLNPMEVAKALSVFMEREGLSQSELADRFSKKRSTIANYLRLLNLPPAVQDSLRNQSISMGHAKVILSLNRGEEQKSLLQEILENNYTVRQSQENCHQLQRRKAEKRTVKNIYIKDLEEKIQKRTGLRCAIQGKDSGNITLSFLSLDDLDHFLELLGIKE